LLGAIDGAYKAWQTTSSAELEHCLAFDQAICTFFEVGGKRSACIP
jgi:hypothetical protein